MPFYDEQNRSKAGSIAVSKFMRSSCLLECNGCDVTNLENVLHCSGPDTAELQMRFGLHSGPVTAGILRGEKCRFQLFGDTVNTCARLESSGGRT